jgi:hypothetical protein
MLEEILSQFIIFTLYLGLHELILSEKIGIRVEGGLFLEFGEEIDWCLRL